tara:strand:+ start:152 stop:736 length:585 start_codon:yes stop_codon:yes gene_type:complete
MKVNNKIIQIGLISIGVLLILSTYFFYPEVKRSKEGISTTQERKLTVKDDEENLFENVEYSGIYNVNNTFTVLAEKAHILKKDPDIVYMTDMRVTLNANDGRIIVITSDYGNYNKFNYDCYFEKNVKAADGETIITSDNLDLLTTKDSVTVYNNVILTNESGTLVADKVEYDFNTKYYQIKMFSNKKVKIKLIN